MTPLVCWVCEKPFENLSLGPYPKPSYLIHERCSRLVREAAGPIFLRLGLLVKDPDRRNLMEARFILAIQRKCTSKDCSTIHDFFIQKGTESFKEVVVKIALPDRDHLLRRT
jgi:hypothetical protein